MDLALQLELCLRVGLAAILSALVGYNRERNRQPAGLRTHMLVGIGSAIFTSLSLYAFPPDNPGRVAAQVVTGIGFLGAGAIIQGRGRKHDHCCRNLDSSCHRNGVWHWILPVSNLCGGLDMVRASCAAPLRYAFDQS